MSELFTQNYSDKPLFHTDTDISENLHNQVEEASNGEELLDNTEKQTDSLLSNDDYVSETKNSISDDRDDAAESLSPPAEGNRKYITGTNTPRANRSNAYYELLCNQQTNGYRSPAMRGTTAAAHGITSASGLVSYQEDFATDAALRRAIAALDREMTVLIVSQRANTVRYADQIVVLDDGKAVGIGTHEQLLKECSTYREIAQSQLSKEELA